jgi:hypothetical protein
MSSGDEVRRRTWIGTHPFTLYGIASLAVLYFGGAMPALFWLIVPVWFLHGFASYLLQELRPAPGVAEDFLWMSLMWITVCIPLLGLDALVGLPRWLASRRR